MSTGVNSLRSVGTNPVYNGLYKPHVINHPSQEGRLSGFTLSIMPLNVPILR